ncbi:hypothetical protein TNCV_2333781 [Trichonephila clavipes]|nr:hypothetical protein TNCV_2333781 [Trichonephila clavipes]
MDHDENLERCKLILTGMDDDARKNRMYHDEIPERCKLNFTGIVDDALRIAGELFPKQTLKKYIRKEVEIDTDGRVRSRRFEKKKKSR